MQQTLAFFVFAGFFLADMETTSWPILIQQNYFFFFLVFLAFFFTAFFFAFFAHFAICVFLLSFWGVCLLCSSRCDFPDV